MRTPAQIHEALVLFTIQASIERGEAGDEIFRNLFTKIEAWKTFRKFSKAEHDAIVAVGQCEEIQTLQDRQISYLIYALVLAKLWAQNAQPGQSIGISKKKLKVGKAHFALDMLKEKQNNPENYDKTKEIIAISEQTAIEFYDIAYDKLYNMKGI